MSLQARRQRRQDQRLCGCGRHAVYLRPHDLRPAWRRDHPLCRRCWARLVERQRPGHGPWTRCVRVAFLPAFLEGA